MCDEKKRQEERGKLYRDLGNLHKMLRWLDLPVNIMDVQYTSGWKVPRNQLKDAGINTEHIDRAIRDAICVKIEELEEKVCG